MSKLIDLTGQRFGRLTVLYRTNDIISANGRKRSNWHCMCDCGTECDVAGDCLTRGKTQSCGCLKKEKMFNEKFIDRIGQKFGRLTVLYENKNDPRKEKFGNTIWHCLCECGNECDVSSSNLSTHKVQSCGCLQKEKASEFSTKPIRKYDENGVITKKLCPHCNQWLSLECFAKYPRGKDGHASFCKSCAGHKLSSRYNVYRTNAKSHNRVFDLTLEEFDYITKQPCYYCGEFNGEFDGVQFSGIDRIDSNIGYIKSNIIPCCGTCNKMKNNLPQDIWILHMTKIINNLQKKELDEE